MYYVVIDDVVRGPFGLEELGQMLEDKKILPISLAVLEGHENWMSLEKIIHIEVDKSPRARTQPAVADAQPQERHTHSHGHGKCTKTCPFCGGKKVKAATREFQSANIIRLFAPKVCRQCEAIWTPKIDIGSAFLIFAVGLITLGFVLVLIMPYILYYVRSHEARTEPFGMTDYIRWGIAAVILPFSLLALGKAGRYVASKRARAFKILRHPHPVAH
jgi:hypothetical protein